MAEAIKRSRLKLDRHPLKPLNEAKNEALRGFHDGFDPLSWKQFATN